MTETLAVVPRDHGPLKTRELGQHEYCHINLCPVRLIRARIDLQTFTLTIIVMDPIQLSGPLDSKVFRLLWILAAVAALTAVFNMFYSYMHLGHIPGPCLAAFTNLVRRSWVTTGDAHRIHTNLHRQYGTVVRIGPNAIMVSQPKAIDHIYGFKNRFQKVLSHFLPYLSLCVGGPYI